jgi:hypothetical protein
MTRLLEGSDVAKADAEAAGADVGQEVGVVVAVSMVALVVAVAALADEDDDDDDIEELGLESLFMARTRRVAIECGGKVEDKRNKYGGCGGVVGDKEVNEGDEDEDDEVVVVVVVLIGFKVEWKGGKGEEGQERKG